MRIGRRVSVLAALLGFSVVAFCEPVPLPPGSGPVPALSEKVRVGAIVGAEQAELYRALLPPEVLDMAARGDLAFEAADVELPRPSSLTPAISPRLLDSGEIDGLPAHVEAPIFSAAASDMDPLSPAARGYRLLWNAEAIGWSQGAFSESLRISAFPSRKSEGRQLEVTFARAYPAALGSATAGSKALFRERIRFQSPSALLGLTWLSFRLPGRSDDYVWASSPVTFTVRQMAGSVRSDDMFPTGFAANDLHVWSGKIESVVPRKVDRTVVLVPVLADRVDLVRAGKEKCVSLPGNRPLVSLNAETRRYPPYPGWVPTNVRLVPRRAWRLELSSRDPYDLDAIQALYVDEETSLPVYRVAWGEDGALRKVVLGVVGFLGYENRELPWILGELVHSVSSASSLALRVTALELCSAPTPGNTLEDFDPAALSAAIDALKKGRAPDVAVAEGAPPESE